MLPQEDEVSIFPEPVCNHRRYRRELDTRYLLFSEINLLAEFNKGVRVGVHTNQGTGYEESIVRRRWSDVDGFSLFPLKDID